MRWSRSLETGSKDENGRRMGGTEMRAIVNAFGKLFVANGYWTDKRAEDPNLPGAQILVLDKSPKKGGRWRVDLELEEPSTAPEKIEPLRYYRRNYTFSAMERVTFAFDRHGKRLPEPVTLLVASAWNQDGHFEVYSRDRAGAWKKSEIAPGSRDRRNFRSFTLFHDEVGKRDLLLAGSNATATERAQIFAAQYDSNLPSRLVWAAERFLQEPAIDDRVMAFEQMHGTVWTTVCEKVYRREVGKPIWKLQYSLTDRKEFCPPPPKRGAFGLRGTTIINSNSNNAAMLLATEGDVRILRLDLQNKPPFDIKRPVHQELDVAAFVRERLGLAEVTHGLAAYNRFVRIELPNGTVTHFIGIQFSVGRDNPKAWYGHLDPAYFLVRFPNGQYELGMITPDKGEGRMISTRDFRKSPFDDEPNAIYAIGYDGNGILGEHHNTGWIYRGEMQ
jgi:hypothetical protein